MSNGLVNGLDGFPKAISRMFLVLSETLLECIKLAFKICDVDVLRLHHGKFLLVLQRVHGRIAKQGDDGDKKLGATGGFRRISASH